MDTPPAAPPAPTASIPPTPDDRFPSGIPFIVGNEGAERFSFYGMRSILYVYLTSLFLRFVDEGALAPAQVAAAKAHATAVTHLFMAGVYAFPMIGAILADRLLGKFRVILSVSLIYVAGHAMLAGAGRAGAAGRFGPAEWGMYAGLGLIAIGSGGIKPCVSANVGDQFTRANGHLVSKVFQIFYFIINFGSFFATLAIPALNQSFGPEVAFGVPGVLMALATVVFWAGRGRFVKVPPKPGGRLGLLDFAGAVLLFVPFAAFAFFDVIPRAVEFATGPAYAGVGSLAGYLVRIAWVHALVSAVALAGGVALFALRQRIEPDPGFLGVLLFSLRQRRAPGAGLFDAARARFGDEAAEGPLAVLRIMLVFSMVSVFWALFDQHSSTWIEQARRMDLVLHMPAWIWGWMRIAVPGLSVLGGAALLLWVANVRVPAWAVRAVLGVVALSAAACAAAQVATGAQVELRLQASQIAALNPLMVMLIIPGLNFGLWRPLEKRGVTVRPLQKMTLGMFLAASAFVAAALLQLRIQGSAVPLPVVWQVPQYLILTTAEVLVSVTGLEFAYTQAPRSMKSTIMGFWLLCVTIGNLLVAFLSPLERAFPLSSFFLLFAGLMAGAAMVFAVLAARYKGRSWLQE